MGQTRNLLYASAYRGFESHPLRQIKEGPYRTVMMIERGHEQLPDRETVRLARAGAAAVGGECKRHNYRELIADNGLDAGANPCL